MKWGKQRQILNLKMHRAVFIRDWGRDRLPEEAVKISSLASRYKWTRQIVWEHTLSPRGPPEKPGCQRGEMRAGSSSTSLGRQHFLKHSCTEQSLQSLTAFKNSLSGEVTAWPCPGSASERWQDAHNTPAHPSCSTGTLLPDPCPCCPRSALVLGSVVSKHR